MKLEKKSSTALRARGLRKWGRRGALQAVAAALACAGAGAFAQGMQPVPQRDEGPRYPTAAPIDPTPPAASSRRAADPYAGDVFVANAPDTYTVVRGDTLWGISGRFLRQPWRWPEIWQMNRDQIRNPHWIYPGQLIVLDRTTGTMRLGAAGAGGTVKLSPQIRAETSREAIPSIPPEAIEPYLTQPLIVENATMLSSPRIVASRERVVLGAGDVAYVAGIVDPAVKSYQVFRPGRALKDPDTGDTVAWQADYLGTADVVRAGEPATLTITSSKMEMGAGDRLVPATKATPLNYMPHAPERAVTGRILAIYSGVTYAGPSMVVAINRGAADGLDIGSVLAIRSFGRTIVDRTNGSKQSITLPEERKGLLFVFRVFDGVSYGLITSSSDTVEVGDSVAKP